MTELAPWREVTGKLIWRSGRGSVLGPGTSRRVRWWYLGLECGHKVTRNVRYGPHRDGYQRQRGGTRHRSADDMLPAPKRVRCEYCQAADRKTPRA